jgi:hypothetical protein
MMKHLAQIQFEFLKTARKWDDLTLEEQKGYLKRHPKSKRKITARPRVNENVADKLNKKKLLMSAKVIDGKFTRESGLDDLPNAVRLKGFVFRGHSEEEPITGVMAGQSWTPELSVARMFSDGKVSKRPVDVVLYNQKSGFGTESDEEELKKSGYDGIIMDITNDMGEDYNGHASEVRLFTDRLDEK